MKYVFVRYWVGSQGRFKTTSQATNPEDLNWVEPDLLATRAIAYVPELGVCQCSAPVGTKVRHRACMTCGKDLP